MSAFLLLLLLLLYVFIIAVFSFWDDIKLYESCSHVSHQLRIWVKCHFAPCGIINYDFEVRRWQQYWPKVRGKIKLQKNVQCIRQKLNILVASSLPLFAYFFSLNSLGKVRSIFVWILILVTVGKIWKSPMIFHFNFLWNLRCKSYALMTRSSNNFEWILINFWECLFYQGFLNWNRFLAVVKCSFLTTVINNK